MKLTLCTKIISNLRLSGLRKIIFFSFSSVWEIVRKLRLLLLFLSHSVVSDSLRPHGLQHIRLPCPLFPGVCSNSSVESVMPSNHLILCLPLLLLPSIFHSIRSFPMSQLFTSGGQSIGASVSVLPMNTQVWFPLGLTGLISLLSKGLSRVFSNTTVGKFFGAQPSLWSNFSICTWLLEKPVLTRLTFVGKVMALLFNMLSRYVIPFLPRGKHLLISWLQSLSAVILELPQIVCCCFHFFPIYLPWSDSTRCHDLSFFLNVECKASAEKKKMNWTARQRKGSLLKGNKRVTGPWEEPAPSLLVGPSYTLQAGNWVPSGGG